MKSLSLTRLMHNRLATMFDLYIRSGFEMRTMSANICKGLNCVDDMKQSPFSIAEQIS